MPPEGELCDQTWSRFERVVVNGWPVDMIRIEDEMLVYEPLGIKAKKMPWEWHEKKRFRSGKDGVVAWTDQAPFDMEW